MSMPKASFKGLSSMDLVTQSLLVMSAVAVGLALLTYRFWFLAKNFKSKESELSESIKQLQLSAGAADVGVWLRTFDGDLIWASDKWYELYELERGMDLRLDNLLERLDLTGRKRVEAAFRESQNVGDEYEIEYRFQLADGSVRWIRGSGRIDRAADGSLIRRGAAVDITKLKLAQESAHELSRKLMNAQEKERARLARELHDDLSQSLALLSIQLHSIATGNGDRETFSSQLGNITYQIDRLSSDVHRISHQLHPAKLEQLGLVSALRGFCREIGTAHDIKIDFHDENVPTTLANDVSLCLYRVAQESLQNVVKHSGASNVTVDLARAGDDIRLSIADNGAGFDPNEQETREGIGLISMKERLRVVNGTVRVDSTVGSGTKVVVTVPTERVPRLISDVTALSNGLLSFTV
jgi:signal transduction histidine kinase